MEKQITELNKLYKQMGQIIDNIQTEAIKHDIEIWKPIKGLNHYEISSKGRVKNVKSRKLLKPCIDKSKGKGYYRVTFFIKEKNIH